MRENPVGEGKNAGLKLLFDRRLRLEFRGVNITTDAGLLAVRELDEMLGLTEMAGDLIVEGRTGKNIQHQVTGLEFVNAVDEIRWPKTRSNCARRTEIHEAWRRHEEARRRDNDRVRSTASKRRYSW